MKHLPRLAVTIAILAVASSAYAQLKKGNVPSAPRAILVEPLPGGTDAAPEKPIIINFTKPMKCETVEGSESPSIKLYVNKAEGLSFEEVPGRALCMDTGRQVMFIPDFQLLAGRPYKLSVSKNATDTASISLGRDYVFSFETKSPLPVDTLNLPIQDPAGAGGGKLAVIAADWGFGPDYALRLKAALSAEGWTVRLIGELPSDRGQRVIDLMRNFLLNPLNQPEQVFIYIIAHGSGTVGFMQEPHYPYEDTEAHRAVWRTHFFTTNIPDGTNPDGSMRFSPEGTITAADLENLVADIPEDTKVTVLDHSCFAGATVRLLDGMGQNVCAISTAGQWAVGLGGYPDVAQFLDNADNDYISADGMAEFISDTYYEVHRTERERLWSLGFRTGCDRTMPIRDIAANMEYLGTFTQETWNRETWALANADMDIRWFGEEVDRLAADYTSFGRDIDSEEIAEIKSAAQNYLSAFTERIAAKRENREDAVASPRQLRELLVGQWAALSAALETIERRCHSTRCADHDIVGERPRLTADKPLTVIREYENQIDWRPAILRDDCGAAKQPKNIKCVPGFVPAGKDCSAKCVRDIRKY